MLTYNEVIVLRDKLASGEIGVTSAQADYWRDFKDGQKSWQTKDWKERRSKVIKDRCEVCGSNDTLTLQYLSHPEKYSAYVRDVTRAYPETYKGDHPKIHEDTFYLYVLDKFEHVPVPLCPNCTYSNPTKRVRKLPSYRCKECKHEFDQPVYKSVDELVSILHSNEDAIEVRDKCFVSKEWKNNHSLSNIKYWLLREQAKNKNAETIQKEAFLLYLNDAIHYLSFDDATTACKKCAYYFDMKNMELCPSCKQHYKGLQYPTCIPCLPEEKRKAVLESIEFFRTMTRDVDRNLAID